MTNKEISEDVRLCFNDYASHINDKDHRYKSWEYCYDYFQGADKRKLKNSDKELDYAALMLSYYLASWGMLRASSLLEHTYTLQKGLILSLLDFIWEKLPKGGDSNRYNEIWQMADAIEK